MNTDRSFWSARYRSQVGWTEALRWYTLTRCGLSKDARLLEVGCGYGALLGALSADGYSHLTGVDIDLSALGTIPAHIAKIHANGLKLPFAQGSFDACLCHFYLLWSRDPLAALLEMKRVTRPGGWLLALAEPDYGARVDEPAELKPLGMLQTQALQRRSADPFVGAHLAELFRLAGLSVLESGVLKREAAQPSAQYDEQEWQVLEADLQDFLSPEELAHWHALDQAARQAGTRALYVPVHYAIGQII